MRSSIILLFSIAFFAMQMAVGQTIPVSADVSKGYLVGPGDEITGKVLGESQFDFVATVDEDGKIEVPFVDKPMVAKCKSERELRLDVAQALSKYLKNPQLSLRVTQRNSRPPVSIYGEVRQPQQVNLTRQAHLLELISFAGGVTDKSGGLVQVFRTRPPLCSDASVEKEWKESTSEGMDVPSQMYSLISLRQGNEASNPEIFPGDIIVVQKAAPVYVVGEVVRPGELSIPEGGLPMMQAVAMASGMTRDAKTKDIKVYRRKAGSVQPEVVAVNYDQVRKGEQKDIMLEPFDIVEVGKAPKTFMQYLTEFATGIPQRIPIPIKPF
ncbi:MAG TPA: SLBB domain-containing protein [Pyrinomonadaceae bacterium]|nr:SLBB domain-containing protein [Pyrinomonadaceae bacterium]